MANPPNRANPSSPDADAYVLGVNPAELERLEYRANPTNRCYYCKHELYTTLTRIGADRGIAVVADTAAVTTSTQPARANQGAATGALYRIAPDGGWDVVWESREDSPYDVAFESTGTILLSTGNDGKIFRLAGDPLQRRQPVDVAADRIGGR